MLNGRPGRRNCEIRDSENFSSFAIAANGDESGGMSVSVRRRAARPVRHLFADLQLPTTAGPAFVTGIEGDLKPLQDAKLVITRADGSKQEVTLLLRIDTYDEVDYYRNGGILHYVLRDLVSAKSVAA